MLRLSRLDRSDVWALKLLLPKASAVQATAVVPEEAEVEGVIDRGLQHSTMAVVGSALQEDRSPGVDLQLKQRQRMLLVPKESATSQPVLDRLHPCSSPKNPMAVWSPAVRRAMHALQHRGLTHPMQLLLRTHQIPCLEVRQPRQLQLPLATALLLQLRLEVVVMRQ